MLKKDVFGKNKNSLVKKATIYGLAIILIAVSLVPLVSSNGGSETPEIDVIKTGPIFGYVGDEITYTYHVSNTGDVPLSDINVNDDQCGLASYISGDQNDNDEIDTNEVWIFSSTYTPCLTSPNPLINIATASGEWEDITVEDVDEWSVEVRSEPEPKPEKPKVTPLVSSNSYFGNSPPVANASGPYYGINDE